MNNMNLSACAHDRILKVSRTLADLEAISYRTLDRAMWS